MVRSILLTAALCALTPTLAQAQLYSWHDVAGRLVISDRPQNPLARTYAVAAGAAVSLRVTRPALASRAAQFDALITQHATQQHLSPDFVHAVIQAESAFNPRARSAKGAMGLMQLMPRTAADYRIADPYDPGENIRGGVSYLKALLTRYHNDESLALAAYNAGPGAVEKYGAVPPYRETRDYVMRVRNNAAGAAAVRPPEVFRTVEMVNGRTVVRYTDKPRAGATVTSSVHPQ